MITPRTPLRRTLALSAAALALVALAGCSSSDSEGATTTTTAATTTTSSGSGAESAATKRFDEGIQQQLADVGCYTGSIDGILGPESDAAIVAFQSAEGLTTDGELGPQTETALSQAAEAGDTVCTGDTTTTTAASTTTTAASGGEAPCTATAIAAALPSGAQISSYVCSEGYAAGSEANGDQFILQSTDGAWATLPSDPCGAASAGLPAVILEDGCPA